MSEEILEEKNDNFKVIGGTKLINTDIVKRVLPEWLANPSIISADLENVKVKISRFESLANNLDETILQNLKSNKIKYFFPVQMEVIPFILEGNSKAMCIPPRDLCVSAPTGSGKTLTYVIPLIQILKPRVVCKIRALIIIPVKELALQVYKVFTAFTKGTNLKVGKAFGEKSFQEEQSLLVHNSKLYGFSSKTDILIATPARLVDHLHNTNGFTLKNLQFLVLDEADRLMAEAEYSWLELVEREVYGQKDSMNCHCLGDSIFSRRKFGYMNPCALAHSAQPFQKLLFSATLSNNPESIQRLSLFHPKLYTSILPPPLLEHNEMITSDGTQPANFVGALTTPKELSEFIIPCERKLKPLYAWYLIAKKKLKRVLCFTNTVSNSHRLTVVLKEMGDITVEEYSSKLPSLKRKAIIRSFNDGKIDMLVCSDAMARGMDLEHVEFVLCYDLFPRIETYIHRVGRTARAGKAGTAYNLLDNSLEMVRFKNYMKTYRKLKIPIYQVKEKKVLVDFERYKKALGQTGQSITQEIITKKRKNNRYLKQGKRNAGGAAQKLVRKEKK